MKSWYSDSQEVQSKPTKGRIQIRVYSADDVDKKIKEIKKILADSIEKREEEMGRDYSESLIFEHVAYVNAFKLCLNLLDSIDSF